MSKRPDDFGGYRRESGSQRWAQSASGRESESPADDAEAPPYSEGGAQQEQEHLRDIPDLRDLLGVASNITLNIGVVAGSISHSELNAAGQTSSASLAKSEDRDGVIVWRVSAEALDRLRHVYVESRMVSRAQEILKKRRILILHGRAHWGKATTATWLLARLHPGDVFKAEPVADRKLIDLTNSLEAHGYLIDNLAPDRAHDLRASTLARLSEHLQSSESGGHLVMTVDGLTALHSVELTEYLIHCDKVPEPREVLNKHLRFEFGSGAPTALASVDSEWLEERLRNRPTPPRMRDLADAIATMVRTKGDAQAAKQDHELRAWRYVEEWFESHHARRERCFMLATAVLNGTSYEDVADAADQLEKLIQQRTLLLDDKQTISWRLSSPRVQRVQDSSANLVHPEGEQRLVDLVVLEDPILQPLVLAHAWRQHDDIFLSMLAWLDKLGRQERFELSGRAAAAVGTLCTVGFNYLTDRILQPWATDRGSTRTPRISAAVALATASRAPALPDQVLRLLRKWTDPPVNPGLVWTAATAFGLLGSEELIEDALEGLRRITESHLLLEWLIARSIANLSAAGYSAAALSTLAGWIDSPSVKLSKRAKIVFTHLTRLQDDQENDRPSLPALVRLAVEQEEAKTEVARLWYHLLQGGAETRRMAEEALHRWLLLIDEDMRRVSALDPIVLHLLSDGATRQKTRVALRRCAYDEREPSRAAEQYLKTTGSAFEKMTDLIYSTFRAVLTRPGSRQRLLRDRQSL